MLKIALCDDSQTELSRIENALSQFKTKHRKEIIFEAFLSPVDLLGKISAGAFYDLIFLDVLMPVINGIDVAKEIYKHNKLTGIIFLTSSKEFAADSYSVSALDYIIKPIEEESLNRAMDKFFEKYTKIKSDELVIREKSTISRIPLHVLSYVEVLDHHLIYHMANSYTIRCRQSLSDIEAALTKNGKFIRTNRSFIVNMDYVAKIEPGNALMEDGSHVTISRNNFKAVSDAYLKYKLEGAF
ncbi:MAG: response regulator transcription factor [Clostridia bacterium]|nr:response regulator transcription factor [Clostridia bacterium]